MSTDISLFIEYRDENKKWHMYKPITEECYSCSPDNRGYKGVTLLYNEKILCGCDKGIKYLSHYYEGNYDLFAILANVRNDYDTIKPIRKFPRGVPLNASPEYMAVVKGELRNISTSGDRSDNFLATRENKQEWKEGGYWNAPHGHHTFSFYRLTELNNFDWQQKIPLEYERVEHAGKSYEVAASDFYSDFLPYLNEIAKEYGGSDNIRVVFYFYD